MRASATVKRRHKRRCVIQYCSIIQHISRIYLLNQTPLVQSSDMLIFLYFGGDKGNTICQTRLCVGLFGRSCRLLRAGSGNFLSIGRDPFRAREAAASRAANRPTAAGRNYSAWHGMSRASATPVCIGRDADWTGPRSPSVSKE